MDVRKAGAAVGMAAVAGLAAIFVLQPEPIELDEAAPTAEVPVEAPPATADAAQSGAPAPQPEAVEKPMTLEELARAAMDTDVAEEKEPERWVPPVVAVDGRPHSDGPGVAPQPQGPPTPDIRGIERVLLAHSAEVDVCMRWNAPAQSQGEDTVRVAFTLVPKSPSEGRISALEVIGDDTGRYDAFERCLSAAVAGATFAALRDPEEVVEWALKR